MKDMTQQQMHVLSRPGAEVTYDVRPAGTPAELPPLVLIGAPMDAVGFTSLAGYFRDRDVITYDPRGTARSRLTDPVGEIAPDVHAADVAAVIETVLAAGGSGQVDVFGSSGGAITSLALAASRPELVRVLVAHEPPLTRVLPDSVGATAATDDIYATYQTSGMGPAMAKFIAVTSFDGPLPDDYAEREAPDPAMFGLPTEDDGSRDDLLLGKSIRTLCGYDLDTAAVGAAPTRLVIAVGEDSGQTLAARSGRAVAELLGSPAVVFPGDHGGFLGGEYGMTGKPVEFAAALREHLG